MERAVIKTFPRKKFMPQGANNRNFSDSMTVGALKKFYGSSLLKVIEEKYPDAGASFEFLFADMDVGLAEINSRLPENMPCTGRVIKPFGELTADEQEACRKFVIDHLCVIRDEAKKICQNPMSTQSQVERAMFFFNEKFPRGIGPFLVFPSFEECVYLIDSQPIILLHGFAEDALMWSDGGMQKYFDAAETDGALSDTHAFDGTSSYAESLGKKQDRIEVRSGEEHSQKPDRNSDSNNFSEPAKDESDVKISDEDEKVLEKNMPESSSRRETAFFERPVAEEPSFWKKYGLGTLLALLVFILLLAAAIWLLNRPSGDGALLSGNHDKESSSANLSLNTGGSEDKATSQASAKTDDKSADPESVEAPSENFSAPQMLPLDEDDDSFGKEESLSPDAVKNLEEISGDGAGDIGNENANDILPARPAKIHSGEEQPAAQDASDAGNVLASGDVSEESMTEGEDSAVKLSDATPGDDSAASRNANTSGGASKMLPGEADSSGVLGSSSKNVAKGSDQTSDKGVSGSGMSSRASEKQPDGKSDNVLVPYDEFGDDGSGFRQVDRSTLIRIEPIDIKLAKTDGLLAVQSMSHGCDVSKLRSFKRNSAGVYLFLNAGYACPNVDFDEVRCEPKSGISSAEGSYACYLISRKDRVKIKMNTVLKK